MNAARIEPEWAMATVAFVDIRGFTALADRCTAYEALAYLTDPVNVASRVQDATRDLHERLLVTETTRLLLDGARPELVSRGTISARGKAAPITVYGLARDSVTVSGRFARRKQLT